MKVLSIKENNRIVINVYSVVGILMGLYYLYVSASKLFSIEKANYSNFECIVISLGISVPIFIIGYCIYLFIKKEKSNYKMTVVFSIILLVLGLLQLLVNKYDMINSLYFLFDHRLKYSLYVLGILPIIYLLLNYKRK